MVHEAIAQSRWTWFVVTLTDEIFCWVDQLHAGHRGTQIGLFGETLYMWPPVLLFKTTTLSCRISWWPRTGRPAPRRGNTFLTTNKIASRGDPRRPLMTDVGTETTFRLDQRKHFQKSKHLLRSEISWRNHTSIHLHLRRSTCTSEKIDLHA